jgi:serine/threonine protein kinase
MALVLETDGEGGELPALAGLEVLERIGQGGMGRVYKARHLGLDRPVAVKLLPPEVSGGPDFRARFEREAKILAALDHPNIVRVQDAGVQDEQGYLVMELVEGASLRALIRDGLDAGRALGIARQVCDALDYAHSRGVVHRDVKPENILVDREGRVKLVDFGLARTVTAADLRLTRPLQVMGTPHYMAPEQYEGLGRADHRADLYALGVVLYEMLTGELPVGRFPPPSRKGRAGPGLDAVVLRALEKEPARRYASAAEFRRALEAGRPRSRRWLWALAAAPLLLLLLFLRPPADPRDAIAGTWRGRWASALDTASKGELVSTLSKAPDSGSVRLSFSLRGSSTLAGEGDFARGVEGAETVLTARRLRVGGREVEGFWRFVLERAGPTLSGRYEIRVGGMSDRGRFDQERSSP